VYIYRLTVSTVWLSRCIQHCTDRQKDGETDRQTDGNTITVSRCAR